MSKTIKSTAAGTKPSALKEGYGQPSGRAGGGASSPPGHGNGTTAAAGIRPRMGVPSAPAAAPPRPRFTRRLLRKGGANKHGSSLISNLTGQASVHPLPIAGPTLTTNNVTSRHPRSASLAQSIMVTVTSVVEGGLGYAL